MWQGGGLRPSSMIEFHLPEDWVPVWDSFTAKRIIQFNNIISITIKCYLFVDENYQGKGKKSSQVKFQKDPACETLRDGLKS